MKETLHQPQRPARLTQGGGFKWFAACIAFLLFLLAAGLALVAWLPPPAGLAGTQQEGVRAARDDPPRDLVASPARSLQEILAHPDLIPTHHHPLLGRQAPDIELADPQGKVWNLGELLADRPMVLIFYYGYHCVGCVRQLFEVNKDLPFFREVGARVVAISADAPELTRRRFQQHGQFGFPVLSDPGNKVAKAYQVFKEPQYGKTTDFLRHGTFLIDRDRTVQWANVGDAPFRRNSALLSQLARMVGRITFPGGTLP
jgi:peroxiredoxin